MKKIGQIHLIDPTDDWLMKRIQGISKDLELTVFENKLFINSKKDLSSFFRKRKKSFFQTTFYKQQRKRLHILLDADQKPMGGKWTYDAENRKKYPKGKIPPQIDLPKKLQSVAGSSDLRKRAFSRKPWRT